METLSRSMAVWIITRVSRSEGAGRWCEGSWIKVVKLVQIMSEMWHHLRMDD